MPASLRDRWWKACEDAYLRTRALRHGVLVPGEHPLRYWKQAAELEAQLGLTLEARVCPDCPEDGRYDVCGCVDGSDHGREERSGRFSLHCCAHGWVEPVRLQPERPW